MLYLGWKWLKNFRKFEDRDKKQLKFYHSELNFYYYLSKYFAHASLYVHNSTEMPLFHTVLAFSQSAGLAWFAAGHLHWGLSVCNALLPDVSMAPSLPFSVGQLPPFLSMAISLPCSARLTSYFLRVASFLTSSVWQFPYFLIWVDPFLSVGSFLLPSVGQFPPFLILTSSPTSLVWSSLSSVRLTSYFLSVASCITSWRFCSNMFFSEAFLIPTPFIVARISSLFIFYFNFLHRTYHVLMCFLIQLLCYFVSSQDNENSMKIGVSLSLFF